VIVGPRADELQTGPARVRFSLCCARFGGVYAPGVLAEALARRPVPIYLMAIWKR